MGKILFFDIDGTLSEFHKGIPDSAREALKLAKQNGHEIFVCSGRCPAQIDKDILALGFDGIVGNNGAYVSYRDRVVFDGSFDGENIRHVVNVLNSNDVPFLVQCIDNTMIEKRFIKRIFKRFKTPESRESIRNFNFFKSLMRGIKVTKIFMANAKVVDDFSKAAEKYTQFQKICFFDSPVPFEQLLKQFEGRYEVSGMSYDTPDQSSGEITLKGINKGSGMGKLLEYLGKTREDTIAFGDGPNDFEMIEFAGFSVVMGNGIPELKAKADYITDHISENGLYNAMKKLELI